MDDRFIIESFAQSKANCAAIALIKAAIIRYGIGKVFKAERRNGQWLVTLKDKQMLVLNDADVNRINRQNKIGFRRYRNDQRPAPHKLKDYVRLCFAIMVRNLHMNGYNGKEYTESAAISLLAKEGMEIDHLHSLLGLARKTKSARKLSPRHLKLFEQKRGVLLYSDTHIVVVSNGYYDDFGKAIKIVDDAPVLKGRKANRWYELK